jgi:hypothetical protein
MTESKPKKKFKWGWSDTIIAVSVVCLAAVGGTVYLGTVAKPAQLIQSEKDACTNFNVALGEAYKVDNYKDFYYKLFRAAYKGIDESIEGKELNNDFMALAQFETYIDPANYAGILVTVGDATSKVQADCAVILGVKFASQTPTISVSPTPSPTN